MFSRRVASVCARPAVWVTAGTFAAVCLASVMGLDWYMAGILAGLAGLITWLGLHRFILAPREALLADVQKFLDKHGVSVSPQLAELERVSKGLEVLDATIETRALLLRTLEETLRSNEARYRDLFERNPHPMVVFDTETLDILAANEAAVRQYGFTRQQFLRMTVRHIMAEPITAGVTAVLSRMALDQEQPAEVVHRRRDGSRMFVEVSSHRLKFAGRAAAVAMLMDITTRKEAEDKALRHMRTMEALYESARDQATSLSPAEVARVVVTSAVSRFGAGAAWLGLLEEDGCWHVLAAAPPASSVRLPPTLVIPEATNEMKRDRRCRHYMMTEDGWRDSPWGRHSDLMGLQHGLEIPLIAHDRFLGCLHLFRTEDWHADSESLDALQALALHAAVALSNALAHEQLQAQAQILEDRVRERTAELEAANQELEAFSYSVSHDLRAPLRSIEGFSRLLIREHGHELSQSALKYLNFIRCGVAEMQELIQALLSFSRSGRQPLHLSRVQPAELVQAALHTLHHDIEGRQIEFIVKDMPECLADRTLLQQVFANLISNAVKYTSHRQQAVVEIGALAHAEGPIYYVQDNGVGFDPAVGDRIFGVFQRAHSSKEYPGTGVGLATVHRILSRHHGRIWYETEPDRGATFFFTLGTLNDE